MTAVDEIKIGGMGASRRRVEDDRFIRGRGNYVDDIVLPGMLHMEILRSPLAHARITSIDASKAWEIPGVRLVLTGEMNEPRERIERTLTSMGFVVKPGITKKTTLLVAADPDSLSGKAQKARQYGIPIVGEDALRALLQSA